MNTIKEKKEFFKMEEIITLLQRYVSNEEFNTFINNPVNKKNIDDIVHRGYMVSGVFEGFVAKDNPDKHYNARLEFIYDTKSSKAQGKPVFKNKLHFQYEELVISKDITLYDQKNNKITYTYTDDEFTKLKNHEPLHIFIGKPGVGKNYVLAIDKELNKVFCRSTDYLRLDNSIKGQFTLDENQKQNIKAGKPIVINDIVIQFDAIIGNLKFTKNIPQEVAKQPIDNKIDNKQQYSEQAKSQSAQHNSESVHGIKHTVPKQ